MRWESDNIRVFNRCLDVLWILSLTREQRAGDCRTPFRPSSPKPFESVQVDVFYTNSFTCDSSVPSWDIYVFSLFRLQITVEQQQLVVVFKMVWQVLLCWHSCNYFADTKFKVLVSLVVTGEDRPLTGGTGNVKSANAEDSGEQPRLKGIVTHCHLKTPHHKVMASLRTHIRYCWSGPVSLTLGTDGISQQQVLWRSTEPQCCTTQSEAEAEHQAKSFSGHGCFISNNSSWTGLDIPLTFIGYSISPKLALWRQVHSKHFGMWF